MNKLTIGCQIFGKTINHLMYADDLVIFAPSIKGLQMLINTCVHNGNILDVKFNELKTKCMFVLSDRDKKWSERSNLR